MDSLMVFDDKTKARIGMICFIPIVAFTACLVYYLYLLMPLTQGNYEPGTVVAITSDNYPTLFYMLASAAIITAPIFIYCLVLLAKFKHLNAADKLIWIVFLSTIAPVASVLFWLFLVRRAPKYVQLYPDMA